MLAAAIAGLSGSAWALILILAFVLIWGCVLGVRMAAWKTSRRAARARKLGEVGERRGLRVLRKAGYRIVERQPSGRSRVVVDGQQHGFRLRADALVKRAGLVYVAEFKGGQQVARLSNRHTRRQLLEYAIAFDVDGILLVDAVEGEISTVEFVCADGLPVASRARDLDDDEYEDGVEDDEYDDEYEDDEYEDGEDEEYEDGEEYEDEEYEDGQDDEYDAEHEEHDGYEDDDDAYVEENEAASTPARRRRAS